MTVDLFAITRWQRECNGDTEIGRPFGTAIVSHAVSHRTKGCRGFGPARPDGLAWVGGAWVHFTRASRQGAQGIESAGDTQFSRGGIYNRPRRSLEPLRTWHGSALPDAWP